MNKLQKSINILVIVPIYFQSSFPGIQGNDLHQQHTYKQNKKL